MAGKAVLCSMAVAAYCAARQNKYKGKTKAVLMF